MLTRRRLPNLPVVKRAGLVRENKRSASGASPRPPVSRDIGEAIASPAVSRLAVSLCDQVFMFRGRFENSQALHHWHIRPGAAVSRRCVETGDSSPARHQCH